MGSAGVSAVGRMPSCLRPACVSAWLREQQGEAGPQEPGVHWSQTRRWGVRGVAGEDEGKEEEKSNPLTSKSCTTGTSRAGGHAATKHRETEITTTEATAAAPAQPQSHRCQWGPGATSREGGGMPARDWVQGEKQSLVLAGPGAAAWPPGRPRTPWKPCPDWALTQSVGRTSCWQSLSSQLRPQAGRSRRARDWLSRATLQSGRHQANGATSQAQFYRLF